MAAISLDPIVAKHLANLGDVSADPHKKVLCLRAALCAAALEIRAVDPAAAEQFLREERAIADAIIRG